MALHLPTYLLYGEDAGLPPADVMHSESIAERSSLHSWEIKPHRHEALLQVFWIDKGEVETLIDGQAKSLRGPGVILVMPLAVHGFRWTSDVKGIVFTMLESHVRTLLARDDSLVERVLRSRCTSFDGRQRRAIKAAVEALHEEHSQHGPWRASAVDAAMVSLFVALGRGLPPALAAAGVGDRSLAHVQRFRALVDERFRDQPTLGAFAAEIGITTTQLNRVCRAVLGHPALAVLHARLCLEAQRELAYTTLSIKHIAWKLGFSDAGYFTRFFEREAGAPPSAWRARALARA
ncbi:MAG: helix-turn-helix domain-containing protein [Betaproteobacteria bacterium]